MQHSRGRREASLGLPAVFDCSTRLGVPKRTAEVAAQLDAQVAEWGGDKAIHSVLVANNGLAATKFMRSVRSWAYKNFGNERAVNLIAMATPEDMRADAEHIRMADQFVEVPGGKNTNNYANVQLIAAMAMRTGVDAVWPGWGHASEKPELPEALDATPTGIRFLGPPAAAMAALGDKIGSTILAQSAGVPTIPWSGDGVTVDYAACAGGVIPADVYDRACIHNLGEALECCNRIGYPVMLKASWGGGGKGIRKVMSDDDVRRLFKQVQGEVPGSPIFAMKLAPQSRHLEVQLLADRHGNVCSVFSRDCSVQRRHQKIVEEGPVVAAPPEVLADMERCARALARSVGYMGAATVEFLYIMDSRQYCFLELNPRLQVEHPVTEWISNVNIPACQLLVGMGVPLHAIPDLRRMLGADPAGSGALDWEGGARVAPAGHVVAVRITAENANDGFKPTCGGIDEISFRSTPEVWGYFSVKGGGAIHEYSDSQFGHLFAKGETREAAIRAMVVALKEIKIRGEIRTIVDYVVELVQSPDFVANTHHTGWLDARISAQVRSERPPWHLSVICGTVLRALGHVSSRSAEYLSYLEKGQLPPARISLTTLREEFVVDGVKYGVKAVRLSPQTLRLHLGATWVDVVVRKLNDGGLLVQVDGSSHVVHSEEEALGTRLTIDSKTCLLSNEHDPSKMLSISTGKLVRYLVEDGGHIAADAPYAEVEVMKMMMPLLAPASGKVHFQLPEGSVLTPGQLIARLDLDDPAAVRKAEPFTGSFPELGPPVVENKGVAHRFRAALEAADNIMAGYHNSPDAVMDGLLSSLDDPALALVQWNEVYGVVQDRLPAAVAVELEACVTECAYEIDEAASQGGQAQGAFRSHKLLGIMQRCLEESPDGGERASLAALLEPLQEVCGAHAGGKEEYARALCARLMEAFLAVEERFENGGKSTEQEVIDSLRQVHSGKLQAVLDIVLSHQGAALKCALLQRLMSALVLPAPEHYRSLLRRLAALAEPSSAEVAQRAQQLLEHSLLGELRSLAPSTAVARRNTVVEGLYSGLGNLTAQAALQSSVEAKMSMLVEAPAAVEDALASLLDHTDLLVQRRALATYVRRLYYPFLLHEPELAAAEAPQALVAVWAYDDAAVAATPFSRECHGGALIVRCLHDIPAALAHLERVRAQTGLSGLSAGTLHVVLTGEGEAALVMSEEAHALLRQQNVDAYAPSASQQFELDPVMGLVEPPMAATLELQRLRAFDQVSYTSSRNRQWHIYTLMERKNRHSLPLKRVFLRGVVRQLGKPNLLAATYSSNAAAAASAAMEELEEALLGSLQELQRIGSGREDQPIILTGYSALNKLLGREVYTSHMQLGGPKVMGVNGVSHHIVEDDLAGVACVLRWLAYTPARTGEPPAPLPTADPAGRAVDYCPAEGEKLDPRAAIAGQELRSPAGHGPGEAAWQSGLFDRGSWMESQAGWARTAVTGRARLGGVPVGVIAVETNTVMLSIAADPGMPDSSERVIPQAGAAAGSAAGQVWFPDSALKTAQAIEEFGLEGLPLFILANWRGFSGGQRDLFEGVLQAGSLIVDNLRTYGQPVMVYLPPGCELRGGAWVVIDSQINADMVEMYADNSAQGAVLEPQGVVEIKFRAPELVATMHRIDPVILKLKAEGSPGADAAIKARERALLPVYHQVAIQFAQMHDGPVRMLAKGMLRGIVPWRQARAFFVARLRRRLTEEALLKHIAAADSGVSRQQALALLRGWYQSTSHGTPDSPARRTPGASADGNGAGAADGVELAAIAPAANGGAGAAAERAWQDDGAFMAWAQGAGGAARIAMELRHLRTRAAARLVSELAGTAEGTEGLVAGLREAVQSNSSLVLQLRSLVAPGKQ
ncbi:hypothetical protein CHLNCDRAFT_56737 [Chlorella variabilis]|uniref:Uncharacterized protein n=1 Tax=Chlorella variabilis TaxID=554065 RepID=E1Z4T6_CHLVA|nr:hypothetical protein CHLNCDRAFT_56737 [Chlorella variabilis]EFN59405.1 hypothetical protein CHLNCDRAFT_56737 [Chlorella variabilis]|eukprot:XP_005851507.1 hypothetical protein CHLNCDRAFT_56737 [Chlorella variabilis]